jgi:PAS domain S-box-containing protein
MQAVTPLMLEITPWMVVALILYGAALFRRIERQDFLLAFRGNRLRHSNALMRSVVENSSEAILTISTDLIIELANPAAERLFGSDGGGLAGTTLNRILPSVTCAVDLESWLRNGDRGIEIEGVTQEGGAFEIEATVDRMSLDGMAHYILVARDITERKVQQNLLE